MLALAPVRPVVARVNSALNAKVRRCLTPRPDFGDNYDAAFAIDPDGYRLKAYCGAADARSQSNHGMA